MSNHKCDTQTGSLPDTQDFIKDMAKIQRILYEPYLCKNIEPMMGVK